MLLTCWIYQLTKSEWLVVRELLGGAESAGVGKLSAIAARRRTATIGGLRDLHSKCLYVVGHGADSTEVCLANKGWIDFVLEILILLPLLHALFLLVDDALKEDGICERPVLLISIIRCSLGLGYLQLIVRSRRGYVEFHLESIELTPVSDHLGVLVQICQTCGRLGLLAFLHLDVTARQVVEIGRVPTAPDVDIGLGIHAELPDVQLVMVFVFLGVGQRPLVDGHLFIQNFLIWSLLIPLVDVSTNLPVIVLIIRVLAA